MMARRAVLAGLCGAGAVLAAGGPAHACSCRFATTPEEIEARLSEPTVVLFDAIVRHADYPREGRIIDTRDAATTVFQIVHDWSGQLGPASQAEVRHRLYAAACGLRFDAGSQVLVLAHRRDDGLLRTSICSMPRPEFAEIYRRIAWRRLRGG